MAAERVSVPVPFLVSPPEELEETTAQPIFKFAEAPTSKTLVDPPKLIWPKPVETLVKLAVVEAFTTKPLDKTRPAVGEELLPVLL